MLFSRKQEKAAPLAFETASGVEEETVRRWRDIAAARSQRSLFDDNDQDLNFAAPNAVAPAWPTSDVPAYQPAPGTIELHEDLIDGSLEDLHEWETGTPHEEPPVKAAPAAQLQAAQFQGPQFQGIASQPIAHKPEPQVLHMAQPNPVQPEVKTASQAVTSDLSLPIEQDLKRRFGTNIRSALGPGTVIEGTFRFDSPVCVDGTLTGEITSTSALIVGADASINGSITVGSLIVLGTVTGTVEASELVEIRNGGILEADITTKRIAIEDGAWYSGHIKMHEG